MDQPLPEGFIELQPAPDGSPRIGVPVVCETCGARYFEPVRAVVLRLGVAKTRAIAQHNAECASCRQDRAGRIVELNHPLLTAHRRRALAVYFAGKCRRQEQADAE